MEWYQAVIVFAVAFVVTYVTVPLSKRIAVYLGAIDYPTNRRVNTEPVPRCGGIALYLGLVAGAFSIFVGIEFFGWRLHDLYTLENVNYILLFIGVTLMFAVGLVDDISQLSAPAKFTGQVVAALVIVAAGISIGTVRDPFSGEYVMLGWLDYPLTVFYLVIFVNITNLIDGLDGLASGLVAIVAGSLLYLVIARGSFTLSLMSLALIAVCVAFLRYNFFPASIFMGDSGSHLLGLMVGIISVGGIVRTQSFVVMIVPLVIAGVPVIDTLSAIIRRTREHHKIGEADMGHVHHRLMGSGMGQKRAVLVLWAFSAALAVAGCAISGGSTLVRLVVFVVLAVAVSIVIWKLKLFSPVLQHHYVNKGRRGRRTAEDTASFAAVGLEGEPAGLALSEVPDEVSGEAPNEAELIMAVLEAEDLQDGE